MTRLALGLALALVTSAPASAQLLAPGAAVHPSPPYVPGVASCVIVTPYPYGPGAWLTPCTTPAPSPPLGPIEPPPAPATLPVEPRPSPPPIVIQLPAPLPAPTCPVCPAPTPTPKPAPKPAPAASGVPRTKLGTPAPIPTPIPVLDLNSAPVGELERLPLIDLTTATAIATARPYREPSDLVTRRLLSASVFEVVRPYLYVK